MNSRLRNTIMSITNAEYRKHLVNVKAKELHLRDLIGNYDCYTNENRLVFFLKDYTKTLFPVNAYIEKQGRRKVEELADRFGPF